MKNNNKSLSYLYDKHQKTAAYTYRRVCGKSFQLFAIIFTTNNQKIYIYTIKYIFTYA